MLSAVRVQEATATGGSVVIQVGGDFIVSDASLSALWVPRPATPGECPFPGLDAFGPAQARWFFGRGQVTGDLLAAADAALRPGSGGPVLVVGPSGAGKSSLLGAGLMTELAEGRLAATGSADWPRVMVTPGASPLTTLRAALAACEQARAGAAGGRVVIVVDQLEELFTVCGEDTVRSEYIKELAALGQAHLVVLGLRADFYARATSYPVLRAAMGARQIVLGAMSAAEVRQAITQPAQAVGLTVDDGLAERLLRDLGADEAADSGYEAGRLPLLAHALRATWQRRDGDRLTVAGYEATGGIRGAIAKSAENVYADLDEAGQAAARQVFLSLVRVGEAASGTDAEGTVDTRRRVSAESLYARAPDEAVTRAVVAAFTGARLLTSGGQAVEITHEALLGHWPRLREWIGEDRSGNLLRQDLEEAAVRWDRDGRDPSGLWGGGVRLAAALAWGRDSLHAGELSRVARDFLAAADRRRRRGIRRRNGLIAILAALSAALGVLSVVAFTQRGAAVNNYDTAEASVLAAQSAAAYSDDDPGPAMEFAALGWRLRPTRQTLSALLSTQAVPYAGRLDTMISGDGEVFGVAYSPDGTMIATGGSSGDVRLWSAASYQQLTVVPAAPGGYVYAVAFSPGGRTLAAAQAGGVSLWRVSGPGRLVRAGFIRTDASSQAWHVNAVAFSPGGQLLAAADSDGSVQLWNLPGGTLEASIPTPGTLVRSFGFAEGGRVLAMANQDGAVGLWDLARHRVTVVQQATGTATAVAVSPDGQAMAFAVNSGTSAGPSVKLWSFGTHRVTATITGLGSFNSVSSLAFSADGGLLAAGGIDNMVRVWDLRAARTPVPLGVFAGHRSYINQVAFSPDGSTLASASEDGTVGLWAVGENTLPGGADPSLATAFSPDGRLLAVGVVEPGTVGVSLFSMPSRKLVAFLPAGAPVSTIAFGPDGRTLAVALEDPLATVQLWNVPGRRLTGLIQTRQKGPVLGMAFSPDGRLLATSGSEDRYVRLWDTARRSLVAALDTDPTPRTLLAGTWALTFSPDGRLLAVAGSDGLVLVYDVARQKLVNIDDLENTVTLSVAFSPDGHTLAIGDKDGTVYLYAVDPAGSANFTTGPFPKPASRLDDSSQPVSAVAYEPSGQTLIAAGWDGSIRLWDMADKTLAATIAANMGLIPAMSYSGSTGMIAASGQVTRIWQTNPGQVAAGVCSTLRVPVSQSAWDIYLPEYSYTGVCG